MLTGVDDVPWKTLTGAYDEVGDIGQALKDLTSTDFDTRYEAYELLWRDIIHQGTIYEVTGYVVPFLIELLTIPYVHEKERILSLLTHIKTGYPALRADDQYTKQNYERQGLDFDFEAKKASVDWQLSQTNIIAGLDTFISLLTSSKSMTRQEVVPLLCSLPSEAPVCLLEVLKHIQVETEESVAAHSIESVQTFLLTHTQPQDQIRIEYIKTYQNLVSSPNKALMVRFRAAVSRFYLLGDAISDADETAIFEAIGNPLLANYRSTDTARGHLLDFDKIWLVETAALALKNWGNQKAATLLAISLKHTIDWHHAHLIAVPLLSLVMTGVFKLGEFGNKFPLEENAIFYKFINQATDIPKQLWGRSYPIILKNVNISSLTKTQREAVLAVVENQHIWETENNILEMFGFPKSPDETRELLNKTSYFYQLIQPQNIYQPATYNHAMRAGNTLYVAGQVARDSSGTLVAPFDAAAQAKQVYHNLGTVLEAAGFPRDSVVKVTTYLVDSADSKAVTQTRLEFFGAHRPPHTGLIVASLGSPEVRLEVEVIAVLEG